MRIRYFDLIAITGIHANFNAGLINVLYEWRNNNDVVIDFYSENKHGIIVSEILKKEDIYINLKPCKILNKKIMGGWKTLLRDILGIYYVVTAFLCTRKIDILVFGLVYPISLKVIFFLSLLSKKNVFVCLHGELNVFVENSEFFRNKKYFSLMKNEIMKKNNYLHYIILGEPIYEVTQSIFYKKPIIINLPYIFNDKIFSNNKLCPIVVGQIGSGDRRKGTQYLFEIAKIMKKEVEENKIKFILVGKLEDILLSMDEGLVEFQKEFIEQNEYEAIINNLHFTLQLNNNLASQAIASSSFLDTLKYDKPFFSLYSDYIAYYLKGIKAQNYLYSSINDIVDHLRWFLSLNDVDKEKEYYAMVSNIQQLKKVFSIHFNAKLFSNQIKNRFI